MTKRERMIAMLVGGAIGVFVLDQAVLQPLQAHSTTLDGQIQKANEQLADDKKLINLRDAREREWQRYLDKGLSHQQTDAEGQILRSLQQWAQEARMTLGNTKPGNSTAVQRPGARPSDRDKSFMRLTYRATGQGTMEQIARFIYLIQTAEIPVRISDVTITPKKENTNDFEVNLGVSTIFLAAEAGRGASQAMAAQGTTRPTANAANAAAQSTTRGIATAPTTRPEAR